MRENKRQRTTLGIDALCSSTGGEETELNGRWKTQLHWTQPEETMRVLEITVSAAGLPAAK